MKICQVLGGDELGGLEKHFFELCDHLGKKHEVIAIAHPLYRHFLASHVKFVPLDLSRGRNNPVVLFQLAKAIRDINPDIVHAHANKASAMVGRVLPFLKCHSVATIHSLKSNVRMYRSFELLIAVSKLVADQVQHKNIEVVHNGITPPILPVNTGRKFICEEFSLTGQRPILVNVSRLVEVKGVDLLLRAMKNVDADLLIVGDGSLKSSLESLSKQLKVDDRVHFLGHRNDIARLVASVDLMVIASRKEGFSYVFVEALAVQQIVLSTTVGAPAELLFEEMLVPCEDVEALRTGIARTLEKRDQIAQQFEPLWRYAERELTLEGMNQKVEKLYEAMEHS